MLRPEGGSQRVNMRVDKKRYRAFVHRDTTLILFPNASRAHLLISQRFIEARGGKHLRFKKGYKNVIDKAIELNNQVRTFIPMRKSRILSLRLVERGEFSCCTHEL